MPIIIIMEGIPPLRGEPSIKNIQDIIYFNANIKILYLCNTFHFSRCFTYMNATAGIRSADAEELFRRYWPMALRRCRLMLGDDDSAADAAQEVFVKVLEKRHTLRAEYPSSLLWTMATNHCLNVLRNRARRAEVPDGDSLIERIACSSDIEAEARRRGLLKKIFRRHPENSRTIAVLHLVDGMTLEETAREVGMSVSGVRKRLRALRDSALKITEADV